MNALYLLLRVSGLLPKTALVRNEEGLESKEKFVWEKPPLVSPCFCVPR